MVKRKHPYGKLRKDMRIDQDNVDKLQQELDRRTVHYTKKKKAKK